MYTHYDHNTIGKLGEEVAARFLGSKGFIVFERNYREKWGEIDLIARKGDRVHFVEVKTVSVSPETDVKKSIRAEEHVHPQKLKRLERAIETFRVKRRIKNDFELDIVAVYLNLKDKTATVRMLENVF